MLINEKDQLEFNKLLEGAFKGDKIAQARLKEAVTTDSLAPTMFVNAANVQFVSAYNEYDSIWPKIAEKVLLNDFRPAAYLSLNSDIASMPIDNGGFSPIQDTLPAIPELTPYPTLTYTGNGRFVEVGKHGARLQFSFEAIVNDDWNTIEKLPTDAGRLAARTEDLLVLMTLFDPRNKNIKTELGRQLDMSKVPAEFKGEAVAGPNGKDNRISYGAITAARWQALNTKSESGRTVTVPGGFALVCSPAQAQLAREILAIREIRTTNGKTTTISTNTLTDIEVVESDLIGTIVGDDAWALVPKGGKAGDKTTIAKTSMRGRETPELRAHNATGTMLGGGAVDYREGSFDNDDVEIRVRQIAGAGLLNLDGVVLSAGGQNDHL